MAFEKQYTPRQVAQAVLEKVGEILKKSEVVKSEPTPWKGPHSSSTGVNAPLPTPKTAGWKGNSQSDAGVALRRGHKNAAKFHHGETLKELKAMPAPKLGKAEGSEGHYSMNAAPEEPKAGSGSKPGKCPECGHPTPESGQGDVLPRSKAQEDWMEKGETENSKKMGYKLSEAGRKEREPEASDKAFKVESREHKSSNDPREAEQPAPGNNPKEKAEGNNELAGTTPTQVGQDGKNKPGYDEMKGHLKLAKWLGRMESKRATRNLSNAQAQADSSAQHAESIRNK